MSRQLKLILFVLVFNVIGFAGYLLRDLGLVWLIPILIATAYGAVSGGTIRRKAESYVGV